MAGYLAAGFPGDYYGSDFAKSMDFMGYLANQRQREEAFKNQQINRDMALEDLFHTQQMNPLVREGQALKNRSTEVQIPGLEAVSKKQVGEWDEFNQLKPERIKSALANYYQKTSEAEVKQEVAALQKAVLDPNLPPQVRKQLQLMLDYTPDNYKLNKTLQSREDVAQIRAAPKAGTGSQPKPPAPPKKLEELQTYYLQQALNAETPEQKAYFMAKAESVAEERNRLQQAAAEARLTGKPNIGEIANVPVYPGVTASKVPVPSATPTLQSQQPKQLSPMDQKALAWANSNPNDPRAKEIKKRLGVN